MNKKIFTGNVYNFESDLYNKIIEVFTNENSDDIESVYVLVKKVIELNDIKIVVEGYDVSDLILD